MNLRVLRANLLLLVVAVIWGSTFVAQRVGMRHIEPFTFNFARFFLGTLFLGPLAWYFRKVDPPVAGQGWLTLGGSILAGTILFAGINLQQIGLVSTSAANAAFITGLYVFLVPVIGAFFGLRCGRSVWVGALLGMVGLYLLSVRSSFTLAAGDGWVLAGSLAWAGHVLVIGWLSPRLKSFSLAFGQTLVCAILSFASALAKESIVWENITAAVQPLVFSGVVTTGIAFTLQVIAQKDSPPAHAALIMQLETVFAALAGWLMLGEAMTARGMSGAALILSGMLISQFWHVQRDVGR